MPEYHSYKDYKSWAIEVRPIGLRRLINDLPYFVGDKVVLQISFSAVSEKSKESTIKEVVIWETHQNGNIKHNHNLRWVDGEEYTGKIIGKTISHQGDIAFYLGHDQGWDSTAPLFTADAMHRDRRRYDIFLLVVGGLIALMAAALLGFIKIVPFWKIWIP